MDERGKADGEEGLSEVRCLRCKRLLARARYDRIEIICPRCGFANRFGPGTGKRRKKRRIPLTRPDG